MCKWFSQSPTNLFFRDKKDTNTSISFNLGTLWQAVEGIGSCNGGWGGRVAIYPCQHKVFHHLLFSPRWKNIKCIITRLLFFLTYRTDVHTTMVQKCWSELFTLGLAQCCQSMALSTILTAIVNHLQTSLQQGMYDSNVGLCKDLYNGGFQSFSICWVRASGSGA